METSFRLRIQAWVAVRDAVERHASSCAGCRLLIAEGGEGCSIHTLLVEVERTSKAAASLAGQDLTRILGQPHAVRLAAHEHWRSDAAAAEGNGPVASDPLVRRSSVE